MDDNAKTIINVQAGDWVQQKHVDYEIGNVEAGGIGIQINHHPHFGSIQSIPQDKNYNEVREYVERRIQEDRLFKDHWNKNNWKERAQFLSEEFGWEVDEHSLTVNWNRNNNK